jgi:hypothetical protein
MSRSILDRETALTTFAVFTPTGAARISDMTKPNDDFARFQRRVFDELESLEQSDRKRIVEDFVLAGRQVGIDVAAEMLEHGRSASELFDSIREKRKQQELSP